MNNPPEEGRITYRPKRRTFTTNKEVISQKNSSLKKKAIFKAAYRLPPAQNKKENCVLISCSLPQYIKLLNDPRSSSCSAELHTNWLRE